MVNLRETEIREGSLALVVETYRIANLITDSSRQLIRRRMVNNAFLVSSSIAKAFIALQDDQFEADIANALSSIDSLLTDLQETEAESLLDIVEIQPLKAIIISEQQELLIIQAASQNNNSFTQSPKLEKACI